VCKIKLCTIDRALRYSRMKEENAWGMVSPRTSIFCITETCQKREKAARRKRNSLADKQKERAAKFLSFCLRGDKTFVLWHIE